MKHFGHPTNVFYQMKSRDTVVSVEILHDNTVICQPDLQLVRILDLVGRDDIGADRRERCSGAACESR